MSARPLDLLDVLNMLRAQCEAAGSQQAWAARHGLSSSYICDVLMARRDPGESILRALGIVRRVSYVKVRKVNG